MKAAVPADVAGPRIAPVPANVGEEPLATLFAAVARHYGAPPSIGQRLIANHPHLYRRWLGLGSELLTRGQLRPDLRELAILRVAHNTGCDYEWRSHHPAALAAGLPDAMLASWTHGPVQAEADPARLAVISLADALHAEATVDDPLWDRLCGLFSLEQILELLVLVGHYTLTAYLLNPLRAP